MVQGDAFCLPFKSDSMDIVFHQGLLEHFTNPQDILKENFRVIKPEGLTLADVPQRYHPYTVVKHILIWLNKWFAGWETEFSVRQLKNIFKNVGFEIHHVYGDWMNPSFFYRATREAFKKMNIKLPLYPKPVPVISPLIDKMKKSMKKQSIAFNTFMDIGVIGKKKV